MNMYLPDNASDLLVDYNEKITYVVGYKQMQSLLSGDFATDDFCMLSTDRVYLYGCEDGDVSVRSCDIDDVAEVTIENVKNPAHLWGILGSVLVLAVAYGLYRLFSWAYSEITSGTDIPHALIAVCSAMLTGFTAICGIVLFIRYIRRYIYYKTAIMTVILKDGAIYAIKMHGTNTADADSFKKELRRARAARKAQNPELFLY